MTAAISLFERFGRQFMMDFGFGAFLEKFEEHFGRLAQKGLLVLIGLAVALTCCKIIWELALGPIVTAVAGTGIERTTASLIWQGSAVAIGFGISSIVMGNFALRKMDRFNAISNEMLKLQQERLERIVGENDQNGRPSD